MMKFDELDEKIVAILTQDARTSAREVARLIGLSDTGVRKRLKRFSAAGTAKITAVVTPRSAGLNVSAFIRLQTAPSVARKVVETAAEFSFASFAALTAGQYNVVVLVLTENERSLADMVHSHFRCWEGAHEIDTVQLFGIAKHRLDLIRIQ